MRRLTLLTFLLLALAACAAPLELRTERDRDFAALESRIRGGEFGNVHSLIVMRGDAPIEEAYFPGPDERRGLPLGRVDFTADTLHDGRSISKTVVGILYGIALAEDRVPGLETPAIEAFPEYADLATPDIRRVTIGHMLTMTSGFAWDEFTYPYQDARNSERLMDAAPDRYRYVFTQPFAHTPGARWTYSGGDVAVIAAILERGTGLPLHAYARQALFAPLGIARSEWLADAQGVAFAASGLRLAPRDFAKIGLLMLRAGAWNGRQVVPQAWMQQLMTAQAVVGGPEPCGMRYGYFTWISAVCAEGEAPARFAAGIGYGGQRLLAFPAHELVIVTNAGNYADREQGAKADALIRAAFAAAQ